MIIRTLEDVIGTKGEAHGHKWHNMRLVHAEDGMGVTLTDSILEAGFERISRQNNHLVACYCLEGEGSIEELATGNTHLIRPGTLYAMNQHDHHRFRAKTRMRIIRAFVPALASTEDHDVEDAPS